MYTLYRIVFLTVYLFAGKGLCFNSVAYTKPEVVFKTGLRKACFHGLFIYKPVLCFSEKNRPWDVVVIYTVEVKSQLV